MAHPISLAFLTTFELDPVAAVKVAAQAGYDMVGLRLLPAAPGAEPDYPLMTDDAVLREVRAALSDTGVRLADVEIVRLGPAPDWDQIARFCERGQALGAKHVLTAGDDPEIGRLTASYGRFCELAGRHGLTADLEFMPWTKVPDLATARTIVEGAGAANAAVLVDALHWDRSATTLAEIGALPRARMNYVQFCDGPDPYDPSDAGLIRVARGERLLPGEGGIDLIGLAGAIPDGVPISVEIPHRKLATKIDALGRAEMAIAAIRAVLRAAGRA